ncbi:unannotated protein [freshwater metagenome]|uniref:Unannotated protein n=1 Tax=freshwater metagenome TaxID=449393 RepID=A0A6J7JMG3_9ZZZZ
MNIMELSQLMRKSTLRGESWGQNLIPRSW